MGKRRRTFVCLSDDEEADNLCSDKFLIADRSVSVREVLDSRRTFICLSDDEEANGKNETFFMPEIIERKTENLAALQATSSSLAIDNKFSQKSRFAKSQGMSCPTGFPYLQPWTEKYTPRDISDLAVHSRKISEVREWMLSILQNCDKLWGGGNILLLLGPAGVGKTAVVHTLAKQIQEVELYEWDSPVPTVWKEHLHHVNFDVPYISKVDQFIDFLSKVKKYPVLPLVNQVSNEMSEKVTLRSTKTGKRKVLLIDDLPVVHGQELMIKLCQCLHNFALSARFPTIVIVTEFPEEERGQDTSFLTTDVVQALKCGGAKKVLFNPITANAVRKVLNKIVQAENCTVPSELLSFIAESCGGDIRHAINCLEFLCIGLKSTSGNWDPGGDQSFFDSFKRKRAARDGSRKNRERPIEYSGQSAGHLSSIACRDGSLSLFHALGKVLHNKRLTDNDKDSGQSSINFILKGDFQRYPLKMESPEVLISQAHADATSFLYFLHENVLEFVDDEGIEDVSVAFTYFSDADCLLKNRKRKTAASSHISDEIDSACIAEMVAGSIAARGVLFANTHPAKPRWFSLRAPGILQADRLSKKKKAELCGKLWTNIMGSCTMFTYNVQAAELEPFFKSMDYTPIPTWKSAIGSKSLNMADSILSSGGDELPPTLSLLHDEDFFPDVMSIDLHKDMDVGITSTSDDDIEEW